MQMSLDAAKTYLRIDSSDEDLLIEKLIASSQKICLDVLRMEENELPEDSPDADIAMMYALAYLYEHREEADHKELILTLRSLLFGSRREVF